jgi:hypothetical protein
MVRDRSVSSALRANPIGVLGATYGKSCLNAPVFSEIAEEVLLWPVPLSLLWLVLSKWSRFVSSLSIKGVHLKSRFNLLSYPSTSTHAPDGPLSTHRAQRRPSLPISGRRQTRSPQGYARSLFDLQSCEELMVQERRPRLPRLRLSNLLPLRRRSAERPTARSD